jgi:3-hydroxy acid dehydrogenase/malonic semialdehyde reductase
LIIFTKNIRQMSKTILITGASAGIGKATAEIFAKNNWKVIITGRRKEKLEELKIQLEKDYNVSVLSLCFDIQNREEVNLAINSLTDEWKNIDVLINNAGLALGKEPLQDGNITDWETMIDTNVKGLLYITQAVLPNMIKRKSGHVINLSSTAGKEVYAGGNVYCATKHAVEALTKSLRIDVLPHKIKVSSVSPGLVDTEFSKVRFKGDTEKAETVYKGFTPLYAADVADAIYYAASRPAHVNIGDIVLTCTAQANSTTVFKN